MAQNSTYFAKDPKIKQAFNNATWLFLLFLFMAAVGGFLYFNFQTEVDSTPGYVVGIILLASILFILQSLITWFAHWLPRVNDPDQFYSKVMKLPGYTKIYNAYKSLHPVPTHYTPQNTPVYQTPVEVRNSRIGYIFVFILCAAISIPLLGLTATAIIGAFKDPGWKDNILGLVFIAFFTFMFTYASYATFKSVRDRSVKLKFTDSGLEFGGANYPWKAIKSYEIENRSSGKSTSQYLVITMMDGSKPEILINMLEIWPGQVDNLMDAFMLKMNG